MKKLIFLFAIILVSLSGFSQVDKNTDGPINIILDQGQNFTVTSPNYTIELSDEHFQIQANSVTSFPYSYIYGDTTGYIEVICSGIGDNYQTSIIMDTNLIEMYSQARGGEKYAQIDFDTTGLYYQSSVPDLTNDDYLPTKGYVDTTITYTIFVQGDGADPTDGSTVYFCSTPQDPATNENNRAVIALSDGVIQGANIIMNTTAGNAGSNENISVYVRINNTTDYLIETIGSTDGRRIFNNYALDVPLSQDDIIIIKVVYPTWGTDPTNVNWSGNLLIEMR